MKNNNLNKEATNTENVYLKADKFKELASELSEIKTDIQLMRATAEMFPSTDQLSKDKIAAHYYKAHKYFDLLFSKFQNIEEDLEDIGSVLYAVTELNELKEIVDNKDINYPENPKP